MFQIQTSTQKYLAESEFYFKWRKEQKETQEEYTDTKGRQCYKQGFAYEGWC